MTTKPRSGRATIRTGEAPFQDYDLEGPLQPEMSWLPLSYDRAAGRGSYLMRMAPGAQTIAHEHGCVEEFMVLDGALIDDDGARFGPGDHVVYEPGTRHHSRTEEGCLLLVLEWQRGG